MDKKGLSISKYKQRLLITRCDVCNGNNLCAKCRAKSKTPLIEQGLEKCSVCGSRLIERVLTIKETKLFLKN